MRFSLEKQQFFESTPSYFSVLSVAPQLALRFPEAKLILVLREPISRAFSAWNMYREMFEKRRKDVYMEKLHGDKTNPLYKYYIQGRSGFPSFQEAVELEIELLNTGVTHVPGIVKRGLYAQQLSNYLAHFDQDQILIIGFKELANQTQETLNRTCDFLKVSRFSIEGIDRGYKNARSYSSKMDEASRRLLTSFFELPNKDLENLIGSIPQW